ncbi:MAG: DegT/DnrJ/EryC1/StrS family aminotransferase [Candidatus Binatia bacterium]
MSKDEGARMKEEIFKISSTSRSSSLFSSFRSHLSSFPHVPLAVPYWNGATYRAILDCLVRGKIIDGPELGILQASLLETLGVPAAVLCGSASLGLEIALRALRIGDGDEVIIPTFCCTAVVPPILAVHAVPVLADVGAELNMTAETAEAAFSRKTKAIIVPHLFGNPADIGAICDLARGAKIQVIDDAAQALGATIDGQAAGGFGDAGILSFGREKVCFGLGGGAVVVSDKELASRAASSRLAVPARRKALCNLLSTLIWHRWRRWSKPFERVLSRTRRDAPDKPPMPFLKEAMANLNAAVASSLMVTLQENIRARRERVAAYQELLGGQERLQFIPHRNGSACLTQVMRISPLRRGDDAAARVIEGLGEAGYEVQGSYVPIHLLPGHERCKRGMLAHAENVWGDLIELPCEPEVELIHVERIAAIIKRWL